MNEQAVARPGHTTVGPNTDGVTLAGNPDGPYDVVLGDQRIWSFNPSRDAKPAGDMWHVAWPPPLVRFMNGVGHFTIAEHNTGETLFDGDVTLGTGDATIRVVDAAGHPLSIDKNGHLGRSFSERNEAEIDLLMTATQQALELLNEKGGVVAFLAFGGLLGAVRNGHLIGHDVDVDLGYASSRRSPVDAAIESFRLERLFKDAGWTTWRFSADDFKVGAKGVKSGARWIDIFGGFVADDVFYLMPNVAVPEASLSVLPLGEVVLEGYRLIAPADPTSLLEATYGPGWRVPDPSFKYETPRSTVRRMDAWMRTAIAGRRHWFPFYTAKGHTVPTEASAFAEWCGERIEAGTTIVDVGSGTGRDTFWFAAHGYPAVGLDYAPSAINHAKAIKKKRPSAATFEWFNLLDLRQVLVQSARLRRNRPVAIYARFMIHALTNHGRENLWLFARKLLSGGGRIYLEFRTGAEPADMEYEFGKHFRRYLSRDEIAAEITAAGGTVEFEQEGYGMAVYKNEDPFTCRMVASW